MKNWDALYINGHLATCENGYGLIDKGGIAVSNGRIDWIGSMSELPAGKANEVYDLAGQCVTPSLIDCHTHLIYAGDRAKEFEMRLTGATYEEIAKAGGGIRSTVEATRKATEDELFQQSVKRAKALSEEGVAVIEIKSGYGLDLETELKILRVAKRIADSLSIKVFPTFLGAHTIPKEFDNRPDEYVDLVCQEMIPVIAKEKLALAVDVFCERIAFSLEQTRRVFEAAKQYDLAIKCHAEQLSDSGSAALASEFNALSVDHLEFLSVKGVQALSKTQTVAVLLPGAFYFLREKQKPPIELLRQHQIPMAIATDCNPGTSPTTSLLLMMNMACALFGLTAEEALLGVTQQAAKALGLSKDYGTLSVGKKAHFVSWDIHHPRELAYGIGKNPRIKSYG